MSSADGAPAILDLGVLAGVVVVEDRMDGLAGGDLALDGVEETDELLMPTALHVAADHGSVGHVHRRKQRRRAIALVIMSIVPARPFFIGRLGWVRSSAWIWLFSSTERTTV